MRRTLAVLLGAAVVAGAALSVPAASDDEGRPPPAGRDRTRVEKVFRHPEPWQSDCDFDSCGIQLLFRLPVRSPSGPRRVDATMTVTLDYRTSAGDHGVASAGIWRGDGAERVAVMRPRAWPLASSVRSNTTTLSWVRKGLRARGRRYAFELAVASREGEDPAANQNFVSGRRVAVVVELTPAGGR